MYSESPCKQWKDTGAPQGQFTPSQYRSPLFFKQGTQKLLKLNTSQKACKVRCVFHPAYPQALPLKSSILMLSHLILFFLPTCHEASVTIHNARPHGRAENIKKQRSKGLHKAPFPIPSCSLKDSSNNVWCMFIFLLQWDCHWFKPTYRTAPSDTYPRRAGSARPTGWPCWTQDFSRLQDSSCIIHSPDMPGFWVLGKSLYMTEAVWTNNYVSSPWKAHSTLQTYLPPFEGYFAEFEIAGYSILPNLYCSARTW